MSETEEQKPEIPVKSSNEILSELFNSFDADPPLIIKKEKNQNSGNDGSDDDDDNNDENSDKTTVKKNKKSKKKHKHKDKKHKKKDKKRKRSSSSERSEIDLAEILIKQEKESNEKKIKIEGTNLSYALNNAEIKKEKDQQDNDKETEKDDTNDKNDTPISDKPKEKRIEVKLKTTNLDLIKLNNTEDGELSDSDTSEPKKKKHKHKSHDKSKKKHRHRSRSRSGDRKLDKDDLRNKLRENRKRSRSRDDRSKDDHHSRYRSREHSRDKEKQDRSRERDRRNSRDNPFYRDEDNDRDYRWRKRYRSPDRRDRSNSHDSSSHIDKKKLLEIARKNAIQMMKSGNLPGALTLGPQAQEKVIAAIKAGGKTIEELTDFCKALSKKEEQDGLTSNSDDHHHSDSDNDVPFHHPFQIKDRPTSITMNIKNSVPLPLKTTQERTSELRIQFPVSSGQLHRKTENEWVPVSPKKTEPTPVQPPVPVPVPPIAPPIVPPTKSFVTGGTLGTTPIPPPLPLPAPVPEPTTQLAPEPTQLNVSSVDIGAIVSQRLSAMRKLQENPNDVQALAEMYKSNKEMQTWAESKQQPGQFTGTTGAQILSQAELSSGYQTWAKKDQLQTATPVSGGMGMHLLQKMGWKPGEGLGKEKTGTLEPLLLEVKLDKKGLVANEEQKKKKKQTQNWNPNSLQNKHPVSLLGEYASKKKLGAPQYNLCFECGPDHKKNFLFQVILNGVEYKPNIASPTKKEAKAMAATVCLQHLGLLPPS